MARTKAITRQPPVVAAPTLFPTSSFQSPASVVESALNAESPRVESIQREFGSGLISNLRGDEEEEEDEGEENAGRKEVDELLIEDEELDLDDGDQIGDQAQKTGFWQPLVMEADALEVNHVQLLFASCGTAMDKHLVSFCVVIVILVRFRVLICRKVRWFAICGHSSAFSLTILLLPWNLSRSRWRCGGWQTHISPQSTHRLLKTRDILLTTYSLFYPMPLSQVRILHNL